MPLLTAGGCTRWPLKVPCDPNHSMIALGGVSSVSSVLADQDSVSSPHLQVVDCTVARFCERTWKEHILKMLHLPLNLKGARQNWAFLWSCRSCSGKWQHETTVTWVVQQFSINKPARKKMASASDMYPLCLLTSSIREPFSNLSWWEYAGGACKPDPSFHFTEWKRAAG